jgi:uncharacterized protein (DUF2062 family)
VSRQFLRRYLATPRDLRAYRSLRFALGDLLHQPDVWHLDRRSVSGACAVGLFVAWVPLPIQMVLAATLALLFRVNLPLSVALVWIANPLTMGPMYWYAWHLGALLLDMSALAVEFESTFAWLTASLNKVWKPLSLGCLILGTASAGVGYGGSRLLWRLSTMRALVRRRRLRGPRGERHEPPGRDH